MEACSIPPGAPTEGICDATPCLLLKECIQVSGEDKNADSPAISSSETADPENTTSLPVVLVDTTTPPAALDDDLPAHVLDPLQELIINLSVLEVSALEAPGQFTSLLFFFFSFPMVKEPS